MPTKSPRNPLRRGVMLMSAAMGLLIMAGLRHILVWGEGGPFSFSIRPLLNAFESGCLIGFVALAGLACLRCSRAAMLEPASPTWQPRRVLLWTLPVLLLAIAAPPFVSTDIVDYVLRGRVLGVHGGNPYVTVSGEFTADPFLQFGDAAWKQFPLPYGPLLAELQGGIAWLTERLPLPTVAKMIAAVVLFKSVFAACHVIAALAAASICARIRPELQRGVLVAMLWNPLLLFEGVATGHNDPLVMMLSLVAVAALLSARDARAAMALGCAVLSKFVSVLLGPMMLAWSLRRHRALGFAAGTAASCALLTLWYLRFFDEPGALEFASKQSDFSASSLAWMLSTQLGIAESGTVLAFTRPVVAIAALAAAIMVWIDKRGQIATLLRGIAVAMLLFVTIGLSGFGAWYHLWWVPFGLLLGRGFLYRFAWLATLCSPLSYLVWTATATLGNAHQWLQVGMTLLLPACIAAFAARWVDAHVVAPWPAASESDVDTPDGLPDSVVPAAGDRRRPSSA